MARAADYVKAYPAEVTAPIPVELCSLTLQSGDLTVANLISSGLFGDGGGSRAGGRRGIRAAGACDHRYEMDALSGYGKCDGAEDLRKGLSDCAFAGGPKLLEATGEALGVERSALQTSSDCLRRKGNLSSAYVLCVLEQFLTRKRPEPGTWSVLAAMGPGFCSELVLMRW